jgi:hypothetical protein
MTGRRNAVDEDARAGNVRPDRLVSAMTAAFGAEWAAAIGFPSLPAIDATFTMRP